MMTGTVYKDCWAIDPELKKEITKRESKESRQAYFDFLKECIENKVCSRCGDEIVIDETWMQDEIHEIQFSGMCMHCQREMFGR